MGVQCSHLFNSENGRIVSLPIIRSIKENESRYLLNFNVNPFQVTSIISINFIPEFQKGQICFKKYDIDRRICTNETRLKEFGLNSLTAMQYPMHSINAIH